MSDPTNPWASPVPGPTPGTPDPRFAAPPGHQQYPPPAYGQPGYPSPGNQQYPSPGYQQYPPPAYQQYPAAYPPPGYGYAAPTVFRGNQGLGIAMLVLGAALVLGAVLRAATATSAVHAYDRALAQGIDPRTVTTAHDAAGVFFVVLIPMWIVGALWLSRAHANASALAGARLRRSSVWCWLAWIVPIVSWWFPKQLVDDCWRATAQQLPPASPGRFRATGWWWGAWIAFSLLFGTVDRQGVYFTASTVPDPHLGVHPGLEVVTALLGVVAYALWVPVVLGLSRAQEELAQRFSPTGY